MSGKDIAALKSTEKQQLKKSTENLLGICFGLVADKHINDQEVQMLSLWLSQHQCVTTVWPGNIIAQRVDAILEDGVITAAERQDLLETLQEIAGYEFDETGSVAAAVTAIPYCDQADILLDGGLFCFTGRFVYGKREKCAQETIDRGGSVAGGIKASLQYLVVGANGGGGSKIAMAMELKEKGRKIAIVSEQQWQQALLTTKKLSDPAS